MRWRYACERANPRDGNAGVKVWIGNRALVLPAWGEELQRDRCWMVDVVKGEMNAGNCAAWQRSKLWYSAGRTARRMVEEMRQRAWASACEENETWRRV